ncbi:hypothetical protein BPOR_0174g00020 [Botrytis porri]|uniref:NACHT domain-containing protein n=1 Tax=Botrytis porri TaxID=87229 RepID=A0A4Z1KUP3_9HELO|nr:hypothetical protein BPOR_0174g00020 [Botrytis porri]
MASPVTTSATTHDPWLIARDRFVEKLDRAERALFNEATPENLYYKSSNIQKVDQKNSKTRAVLRSLGPLTKSIQDYGAAMDTFSNIAPLYLAPIWGSLRVILVLASSHGKFYDRIIDTFARVGDILPRLRDYQAIFDQEKHPKFTQTLSAAYLDIIVLCSKFKSILNGQNSSFVKRLTSPLSTSHGAQLDNAVQTFREHREAVEIEAQMCHYIEAKESRELELRERIRSKEQERRDRLRKIISQMATVDCRNKHRRLQKVRHHGTGSWLARMADFSNWRTQKKCSVMSCYGIPGSGKSVLVSSLIDGYKMAFPAETAISYYYCDYADKRTLSPNGLFSFISQNLFRDMNEIPETLIAILEAEYSDEASSPSLDQIVDLLIKAIDKLSSVAIFIDGLDELPESDRKLTFEILRKILNEVTSPVKLSVSSREDVTYLFQSSSGLTTFKVHLQTSFISPDIEAYIRHAIDELITSGGLVLGNLALREDIFNVLRDGAKGIPLHMDELREAIAFTAGDKSWDATRIPNDLRRLIRACGNLIVIDEDTLEVHLAHYTVEQYILNSQNSELAYFHTTREESNRALSVTCVTYLSFTDLEAQVTVYHDIITPNMTILQDAVTTQSLIPRASQSSNFPAKAAKAAFMFRKFNGNNHSNIDYSQYIPKHGTADQQFLDKYRLIAYLKENWLSHTKDFTEESWRMGVLFENLLFKKQPTFSIKPWVKFSSGECAKIVPLCWALAEIHLPLLKKVLANDQRTSDYIGEACLLFWNTIEYHEVDGKRRGIDISNQSLKVLENRSLEEVSSKTDCLFWLYSEMIIACREGNTEILNTCVEFIDKTLIPDFVGTGTCPTLWSLVFSHLQLEATIHGHLMLVQEFQLDIQLCAWVSYEYKGTYFNSLERAIGLPCDGITDYLLTQSCPVSNKARLVAIQSRDLKAAVEFGDSAILMRFLVFLDRSDWESHGSSPFFGIDDQSYKQDVRKCRHEIIVTAASLGLYSSLDMILGYESHTNYDEEIIERKVAFSAAIKFSQLYIIRYLLFTDRYGVSYYWLQSIPSRSNEAEDGGPIPLIEYIVRKPEIPQELKPSVIGLMFDATEKADRVLDIPNCEQLDWLLTQAIAKDMPQMVIRLGARKLFWRKYAAQDLPNLPHEIEEYLWPYSHDHEKLKATVPLVWAVIYNRPQVVEALLSEPLHPSHAYDILELATTCAIMMDSVELFSLLEEVRISEYNTKTTAWGCKPNFFAKGDLLDRAFARGRYGQSKTYLKVARYIGSWALWHWRGKSPDSTVVLRENLKRVTPAETNEFPIENCFELPACNEVMDILPGKRIHRLPEAGSCRIRNFCFYLEGPFAFSRYPAQQSIFQEDSNYTYTSDDNTIMYE